jgi:hypothetical protein
MKTASTLKLRRLFGGELRCPTINITKAKHLELIVNLKDELFHSMQLLNPNATIPPEPAADSMVDFLSTTKGSMSQVASSMAHTTDVHTVVAAAEAIGNTDALNWVNILTNGDPKSQAKTPIYKLVTALKKCLAGSTFSSSMEKALGDETLIVLSTS